MKTREIHKAHTVAAPIEDVWDFFTSPGALAEITPPAMRLEVLSRSTDRIEEGTTITYRMRPALNVPVIWVAEVTRVEAPRLFVDTQVRGPHKYWRHQHIFNDLNGHTEIEDLIHYALPLGPLGAAADYLFLRRMTDSMFDYRRRVLEARFGRCASSE